MCEINFYYGLWNANQYKAINCLDDMMKQYPNLFYSNAKIGAVYGCPIPALWAGGRTLPPSHLSNESFKNGLETLNSKGIGVRLTFSNLLLTDSHLSDEYCNFLLDTVDNGFEKNEIIIASQSLYDYINKTHPNLGLISSITQQHTFDEFLKEFEKNYRYVVVYPLKENKEKLLALPQELKDRTEILANSPCGYCAHQKEHYTIESQNTLNYGDNNYCPPDFKCRRKEELPVGKSSAICADELWGDYVKAGFSHFKMTGRGNSHPAKENCNSYCYMVRPVARKMMFKNLMTHFN